MPRLRGRSHCRRTTRLPATRSRGRTRVGAAPRLPRKEARSAGSSCGPSRFPAMVFLVSNPLGWLMLFLMCLGIAVLTGFGGIL